MGKVYLRFDNLDKPMGSPTGDELIVQLSFISLQFNSLQPYTLEW